MVERWKRGEGAKEAQVIGVKSKKVSISGFPRCTTDLQNGTWKWRFLAFLALVGNCMGNTLSTMFPDVLGWLEKGAKIEAKCAKNGRTKTG